MSYVYFVADMDGSHRFSKTYEEHLAAMMGWPSRLLKLSTLFANVFAGVCLRDIRDIVPRKCSLSTMLYFG